MTALALVEEKAGDMLSPDACDVPTERELETMDGAIAEIDLQLADAHLHSLTLRDRREDLLAGRAELRRKRERAGLFEVAALVRFFSIEYVGTVAEYEEHDPKLMKGDGRRQRWPPGGLERICGARARR